MARKISIIGSGALGTALAKILFDAGQKELLIYGINTSELRNLQKGTNPAYFGKLPLPQFETTTSLDEACQDAQYIVLALPSFVIADVYQEIIQKITRPVLVINGSKGFYPKTQKSLHHGLMMAAANNHLVRGIVSLIGPSHAEEMVREAPTLVSAVTTNVKQAQEVQKLFTNHYLRVYVQTDVIGAEVGSAYKNVIAIATGIATGMGYGINTLAALMTRGLAEMARFNQNQGGKTKTLMGLSGVGDLIVTALSPLSRNYSYGFDVAKSQFTKFTTTKTVEGLKALKIIYQIGQDQKLRLPIVEHLYQLLILKTKTSNLITTFWSRDLQAE